MVRFGMQMLLLLIVSLFSTVFAVTKHAPNEFLGQCLDDAWVSEMETKLGVSATERDALGRLVHPHLHAALTYTRFRVEDPRTTRVPMSKLYQDDCRTKNAVFYGPGATVDGTTGAVTDHGDVNGSVVIEMKAWATADLTMHAFAILAREVLGYPVSYYRVPDSNLMGQRMSSVHTGACTPVHLNLEEWGRNYEVYSNESFVAGGLGYFGRSGLFTTKEFVLDGTNATKYSPTFDADFWRDYSTNEHLIENLAVSKLKSNSRYFPPTEVACSGTLFTCVDSCTRTDTCTEWEAQGKECLVVALMYDTYDTGNTEAAFANLKIPAYFCYLGYSGIENLAVESAKNGTPVLFYHYEPDPFHVLHQSKFERVFLPRALPELLKLTTYSWGENGFGNKTNNPLAVDFPTSTLLKYAATVLQDQQPIANLVTKTTISEFHITNMLKSYVNITSNGAPARFPGAPEFSAACSWVRDNYKTWRLWADRLPLCNLLSHMRWTVSNCDAPDKPRAIVFTWQTPHPDNASLPYVCDGGFQSLPEPLQTSRSCEWIDENPVKWLAWLTAKPTCDPSFYDFRVSECDAQSTRLVEFYWLLADPSDPTRSLECEGGDPLPAAVSIACEYTPHNAPFFLVATIFAAILAFVLFVLIGFVYRNRMSPIIKRSQYEFLIVMLVGGILMCAATLLYAGKPTSFLCGARPAAISLAFTLIFGALVVKSMRVYRVFMSGAMKRVVLSTTTMFKILGLFTLVDGIILLAWFVADFPKPDVTREEMVELRGGAVERLTCQSTSFIFSALLIFWKAIVLCMGLYLSFLIRNVSTDFQESIWIFASSVVVLFGSVLVLPMAYLVKMEATAFYIILTLALLVCTTLVMGMMLGPKIRRLNESSSEVTNMDGTTTSGGGDTTESSRDEKASTSRKPAKVKVKAVMPAK